MRAFTSAQSLSFIITLSLLVYSNLEEAPWQQLSPETFQASYLLPFFNVLMFASWIWTREAKTYLLLELTHSRSLRAQLCFKMLFCLHLLLVLQVKEGTPANSKQHSQTILHNTTLLGRCRQQETRVNKVCHSFATHDWKQHTVYCIAQPWLSI